jgi:hypothetical protein
MALVMMIGFLMAGGIGVVRLSRIAAAFDARATAFATNEKWYASRAKQLDLKAREGDAYERMFSRELADLKGMDRIECSFGIAMCRAKSLELKKTASRCLEKSNWCAMMSQKYHAAAARPWLSVAPDPPEPE